MIEKLFNTIVNNIVFTKQKIKEYWKKNIIEL